MNEKTINYIPRLDLKQYDLKRVAVYARVSREGELKHQSIENQRQNLEKEVNNHPGWLFVGAYIDEGVTGTKMNRPEFNRLMEDARAGKIDIILTKSVSRFGRNIAAVQKTLHELSALNVSVLFDSDGINSADHESTFYLQYLSIQAENEARDTSEYQKWAIRNKFKLGIPHYFSVYGYRMIDHHLEIVPEEAKVVKTIFDLYLSGMGREAICKKLIRDGIPSPQGTKWRSHTLYRILTNEKYAGNLLLQKWYRRDVLTKKSVKNTGEFPQYLVPEVHTPIIDQETFDKVQKEIERRAKLYNHPYQPTSQANLRLYTGLIICGNCQSIFKYKLNISKNSKREIWLCHDYLRYGKAFCDNKAIPENILNRITTDLLQEKGFIKKDTPLTPELLRRFITKIIANPNQELEYHLANGEIVIRKWQFISRKESWTDEMKKQASKRTKKIHHQKEVQNE